MDTFLGLLHERVQARTDEMRETFASQSSSRVSVASRETNRQDKGRRSEMREESEAPRNAAADVVLVDARVYEAAARSMMKVPPMRRPVRKQNVKGTGNREPCRQSRGRGRPRDAGLTQTMLCG